MWRIDAVGRGMACRTARVQAWGAPMAAHDPPPGSEDRQRHLRARVVLSGGSKRCGAAAWAECSYRGGDGATHRFSWRERRCRRTALNVSDAGIVPASFAVNNRYCMGVLTPFRVGDCAAAPLSKRCFQTCSTRAEKMDVDHGASRTFRSLVLHRGDCFADLGGGHGADTNGGGCRDQRSRRSSTGRAPGYARRVGRNVERRQGGTVPY
jgi:hypothetical protein